jgi:hypothetical protein
MINYKRWLMFFFVGLPIQAIVYLVYPLVAIYFHLFIKKKAWDNVGAVPFHIMESKGVELEDLLKVNPTIRDMSFLDNDDTHCAITHSSLWGLEKYQDLADFGLKALVREDGAVKRRYPVDQDYLPVSGDCLASWNFAVMSSKVFIPSLTEKVVDHYTSNCFGLQHYNGKVSARSSNSGVNLVFDGWKGLNFPAFGPQYYTTAATLAMGARLSTTKLKRAAYTVLYYAHFLLMGGWLWWIYPIIYSKTDLLYYTHHVTALNLYTLNKLGFGVSIHNAALRHIVKDLAPAGNCNPFLYALGFDMGALSSQQDWQLAKHTLLNMANPTPFMWQREPLTNEQYLNPPKEATIDPVQLAFVAELLLRNK